ncbi:TRAP transporter large permease [Paracoccus stylophorae]|uniref:TRAP transporter large permease protein n=1 Tax=Paracoccus stylophorae TaxID=659350 RepID=A0ABY7SV02_9RHOB|nr:TRAP transporter large permease [Paracoccus stylophorae]WCR10212.1 TRAP transporter large permease [Paracoccus stylophorae]
MAVAAIGVLGLLLAAILLMLRAPIPAVLAGVAVAVAALIFGAGSGMPGPGLAASAVFRDLIELVQTPDIAMIPLFVLLGNVAFYSGISTRIYDAAAVWLRPMPGGLAMAAVMGCGGFSAISGSSVACASTMGRICVPEMLRAGYDPKLATASVAVGGTLGSLIPPSVLFILYGIFTDTSIARLFLAGLLPGLLSLAGMLAVIAWWVGQHPQAAPRTADACSSRAEAAIAAWPALLLFAVIVGGIYGGIVSVTQAAAICVALTLVIGFAQRRLTPDVLWRAVRESAVQSLTILLIVAVAKIFVGVIALTGTAAHVVVWAEVAQMPFFLTIAAVVAVYLLLGLFLDPVSILVLTLPFAIPLVEAYGLDPIWFGVIVIKLLEIGLITPPVGLNVFVIGQVTPKVTTDRIFAGVARFLAVDMLVLLILILFPVVSTLLPSSM